MSRYFCSVSLNNALAAQSVPRDLTVTAYCVLSVSRVLCTGSSIFVPSSMFSFPSKVFRSSLFILERYGAKGKRPFFLCVGLIRNECPYVFHECPYVFKHKATRLEPL